MGARRRALLLVLGILVGAFPPGGLRAQPFPPLQSPEPPAVGEPPAAPAAPLPFAEPADPPTPMVSLRVRAPANAAAGQEVDYRILVENPTRAAAHHVIVRSPPPTNAAFVRASPEPTAREPQVLWDLGTLQPGASKEILLTLKPNGGGDVDVTARVQFEHGESVRTHIGDAAPAAPPDAPPAPMPPAEPPPAAPPAPAPKAALRLRKTGPARAMLGDLIPFQLNVTNTGTADAVDVELDDSLPPGLELWSRAGNGPSGNRGNWKIGRLAPGETAVREYEAFAKAVGDQDNVAQATAAGGLRETASWRVRVEEPKLTVAVAGPPKRLLNRPAKYQITVANAGATPLANVEASIELPADVKLVGAPSDNGRSESGRVHWLLGNAPAGGRRTVSVELTADKEMEAVVRVTAACRGVTSQAEATTRFEGAAGLRVEIDKSADPVEAGRDVEYTVHVLNRGSAAARNVRLTVTAPDDMRVASADGPGQPAQAGQTLTFPALAALGAGKDATYKTRLRALRAGEVKLTLELRSDDLAAPLREEETTTIFGEAPASPPPGGPP